MNFPDASRGETLAPTGRGCGSTRDLRGGSSSAARPSKRRREEAEPAAGAEPARERHPPGHGSADHAAGIVAAPGHGGEDDSPAPKLRRRQDGRRVITIESDDDDDSDEDDDDAVGHERENLEEGEADDGQYYRGVSRSFNGSYSVSIYVSRDEPPRHLGTFRSRAEAARAWDKAARSMGRKELNFPEGPDEMRVTRRQQTLRSGGGAAGCRQVLALPQPPPAPAPEVPRVAQAARMMAHRTPPPPLPPASPAGIELLTPPPPAAAAVEAMAAAAASGGDAAAAGTPLTTLQLVNAIRPPLVDAAGVAALLVAADYATVEQLAVLRGGSLVERHAELEMLGVRSHFNRAHLLRTINALPPPPPPPPAM